MGPTACTEPQCLFKGALYVLPFPRNSAIQLLHKLISFQDPFAGHPLLHVPCSALRHGYRANMLHLLSPPCMLHVSNSLFFFPLHVGI